MGEAGSIRNWTEEDRPREKMLARGAASLTDSELLAILISSGTREHSALDLAKMVLELAHGSISELGRLSIPELQKVKGIGEARAITICSALELGRRRQFKEGVDRASVTSSRDAAALMIPLMNDSPHEVFYVVYLNQGSKLIKAEKVSDGGLTATIVDVRIILKNAFLYNSNQIIMAHNHPSGSLLPSEADKHITQKMKEAAKLMDIKLLDHIIVGGNSFFSFADEGML
jgi:DNA repair protein RadC